MLYAHYYKTSKAAFVVISTDNQGRDYVLKRQVKGKIEARKVAAEKSATCWNF